MKKNEWIYLAKAMWTYAEKHEGKISRLLKELVKAVNKNMEMIINDNEQTSETIRKHRPENTNTTSFNDNGTSGNIKE